MTDPAVKQIEDVFPGAGYVHVDRHTGLGTFKNGKERCAFGTKEVTDVDGVAHLEVLENVPMLEPGQVPPSLRVICTQLDR